MNCLCKNGYFTLKKGKFGEFYSCSDFPKCKITLSKEDYEEIQKENELDNIKKTTKLKDNYDGLVENCTKITSDELLYFDRPNN